MEQANLDKGKEEEVVAEWEDGLCYRFDPNEGEKGKWIGVAFHLDYPAHASSSMVPDAGKDEFRIVTYNVLFDLFDPEKIFTALRVPHVVRVLRDSNADIMVLQEVTPIFLRTLLKEKWIRDDYWASDSPDAKTVSPYGQVVLMRHAFSVRVGRLSRIKRHVFCSFLSSSLPWRLCGVHLTSNYRAKDDGATGVEEGASKKRQQQLREALKELEREGCGVSVVAGDFNYDAGEGEGGEEEERMKRDGWRDEATEVTFDAQENPTAVITSGSGKKKRYDRVIVRGGKTVRGGLLGTQPIVEVGEGKRLCPSDHYCVVAVVRKDVEHEQHQQQQQQHHQVKRWDSLADMMKAQEKSVGCAKDETDKRRRALREAERRLRLEQGMLVEVGSVALGCCDAESDADCVAVNGIPRGLRRGGARAIACWVDGMKVEVQDGREEWALEAIRDNQEIKRKLERHGEAAVLALQFFRLFCRRALIYGGSVGLLGGAAVATMVAKACDDIEEDGASAERIVRAIFERYSNRNGWDRQRNGAQSWLPLVTVAGGREVIRNATRSSEATVLEALREAQDAGDHWGQMLMVCRDEEGKSKWWTRHGRYVRAEVHWRDENRGEEWSSWALSRVVGLIVMLEKATGGLARPYPKVLKGRQRDGMWGCCVVVGVEGTNDAAVRDAADRWLAVQRAAVENEQVDVAIEIDRSGEGLPRKLWSNSVEKTELAEIHLDQQEQDAAPAAAAAAAAEEEVEVVEWDKVLKKETSEHVFNRVKWDPSVNVDDWEIGWEDRFEGIVRKPITAYKPGGAVPWHRVRVFWYKGEIVWQRIPPKPEDNK